MPHAKTLPQAPACGPTLVRLLKLISRRGAHCRQTESGGGVISGPGPQGRETLIDPETWSAAVGLEFIRLSGGVWKLTDRGRVTLRRWLSSPAVGARKSTAAPKPSTSGGDRPGFNEAESPLTWLSRRKDKSGAPLISESQLKAGERLTADFFHAQLTPRVSTNWSGMLTGGSCRSAPGAGLELHDSVVAAKERVRLALTTAGPGLSDILIDVCCHQRGLEALERAVGWPQRSARVVLLIALDRLAIHYGFATPERGTRPSIRHWGGDGYRPVITPDDEPE